MSITCGRPRGEGVRLIWTDVDRRFCSVLFSALLASRVGRIMHDVPPMSSVFRHSYQVLLCSSGPCSYIIHPVDPRSSFSPSSRNHALYEEEGSQKPDFLVDVING